MTVYDNFRDQGTPPQEGESPEILDLDADYPTDRCGCGAHLYTDMEQELELCLDCASDHAMESSIGSRITAGFLLHEGEDDPQLAESGGPVERT